MVSFPLYIKKGRARYWPGERFTAKVATDPRGPRRSTVRLRRGHSSHHARGAKTISIWPMP